MWILELDDTEICLSKDGEIFCQEPGIAWAEVKELSFGEAALKVAKLFPARVHTQYWNLLDQSHVEPKGFAVETQADLVYQQLLHIKKQSNLQDKDEVLIVVPSDRTEQQLRLLYGIALKAGYNVIDFVDLGVAGALSCDGSGAIAFVSVGMQRTVITHLKVNNEVVRERVSVTPQLGILPLTNTWIRMVAEKFLASSRFDPRKFGETEQQIFNQILAFVRSSEGNSTIDAQYRGTTRQVEISKAETVEAAQDRYASALSLLTADEDLVLSHATYGLPGLADALTQDGRNYSVSTFSSTSDALTLALGDRSDSDQCSLHTTLLKHASSKSDEQHQEEEQSDPLVQPTHILHQATAYPIGPEFTVNIGELGESQLFTLQQRTQGTALKIGDSAPIAVNGTPVEAELFVQLGDRISVLDRHYELITVQS
ncbi:MAG: hypothetical protein F4Z01_10080 [Gammaproteobacteria bacterium]|nr:hypothetical protein [Gammaproteobacteria bacterium]MYF38378.1 hypothetical protein [Gammaproteobacteria bacterium]